MDQVAEIKARLDIKDLVENYVKLKKSGTGYTGLCPFHQEKTASFLVSPDKQIAYCFGCNQGGDVFTFLQLIEGISFPEALKILAERTGVTLKKVQPAQQDKKLRLLDIHKEAAIYFYNVLRNKTGEATRDYLSDRGVSSEMTKKFGLGYAPDSWSDLAKYLSGRKFTDQEIIQSGLAHKSNRSTGLYDRFRGRLIFPLFNALGGVVGFGGRTLVNDKAKYINSSDSMIYDKSNFVYGLYQAKDAIKKAGFAIIVEGYMDVIACHSADTANTVATCGTALTLKQLRLISRYTKRLAFAFDMDQAGEMAAKRGVELALREGFMVDIIAISGSKDPDECIQNSVEDWRKAVDDRTMYVEYFYNCADEKFDTDTLDGKKQFVVAVLPHIAKLDELSQVHYLQKMMLLTGFEERLLRKEITKLTKSTIKSTLKEDDVTKKARKYTKEHYIFGLLAMYPENLDIFVKKAPDAKVYSERLITLLEQLKEYYLKTDEYKCNDFFNQYQRADAERFQMLTMMLEKKYMGYMKEAITKEILQMIEALKKEKYKEDLLKATMELKRAEQTGDRKEVADILKKISRLCTYQ